MRHCSLTITISEQPLFLHTAVLAALLIAANPALPLLAQDLPSADPTERALDSIVDAPVAAEEKALSEEQQRIASAIANSRQNAARVRKLFNIEKLDIVFVPQLDGGGSPLSETIEKNNEAIEELRNAIEGSALVYHAIDSRSVLLRNVVGVEFGEGGDLTVFAAGKNPEG
jgi:hypothetical protein